MIVMSFIRRIAGALGAVAACAIVSAASAQSEPAPIRAALGEPGVAIPADFAGLSFETKRMLAQPYLADDAAATTRPVPPRLFAADDGPLVAMVRTLGIRSLRIGGNTADRATVPLPTHDDVDATFSFARAAGARVIYTLRLRDAQPEAIAETAAYVASRHGEALSHLAIGNEPDAYFKTYAEYRAAFEAGMRAVSAAAPDVRFCGPCTTQAHPEWAARLARDFASGRGGFALAAQHFYPCSDGRKATDRDAAIAKLLSPDRLRDYAKLRDACLPAAREGGTPFRLEETNNFYNGGAAHASDTFASALWALDLMHWWAANGAAGVNFHTSDFFPVTLDDKPVWYVAFAANAARDGYVAKPLAYALAAFDAAAPRRSIPVTLDVPDGLNVTAYATAGDDGRVSLTVINKSFGPSARAVSIAVDGYVVARQLRLAAPAVDASSGVTLGDRSLTERGTWDRPVEWQHEAALVVPATAAVVAKLQRR